MNVRPAIVADVADVLGPEALTIAEIAHRTGATRRAVEGSIEELRRAGVPVCSGSHGVWITSDPDELLAQYRALRRRALRQLANLREIPRTAERLRKPLTLWAER